jgi:biotin carboxylase
VVAGSEWGVTFAEEVAHIMGLSTNRHEALSARRDKFDMIEAARRQGLRVAEQCVAKNLAEAHDWVERHGKWPIVIKPMASAGSDGLAICRSHADINDAFAKAFGKENFMGCFNDRLLVQSYLPGPQFIVNTVSWQGRHYVTDVWAQTETRAGTAIIPNGINLLDPTEPTAKELIAYTLGVLAALGIENGPAHTELKLTPEGPALIETGARLMGAAMDEPSYHSAGTRTQANVWAGVLAGTDAERETLFAKGHYRRERHMTKLLFNFQGDAVVRRTDGLRRLSALASFDAHYRPLAEGARVWKTADWLACGGVIYLVHDDEKQIAGDIAEIRNLERRGELYGLETTPASEAVA